MSYVDTEDLETLISDLNNSVSDSMKELSIKASERWIDSELNGISVNETDDLLVSSSTYFAFAFLLRKLYDTDTEESNTALWFENIAKEDIRKYINKKDITDTLDSPYSSSKSKPYRRHREC